MYYCDFVTVHGSTHTNYLLGLLKIWLFALLQNLEAASAGRRILHGADGASTSSYEENIKALINNDF